MLRHFGRARLAALRALDLVGVALALPVAKWIYLCLHHAQPVWVPPIVELWPAMAALLLGWLAASAFFRVYEHDLRSRREEASRALLAVVALAVSAVVWVFAVKQGGVSRLMSAIAVATAATFVLANRAAVILTASFVRRSGRGIRHYAIVGSGDLAREVLDTVASHPEWGLKPAGVVLAEPAGTPASGEFVLLGTLPELGTILEEHVLDEVIFAVPRDRLPSLEQAVLLCEELGVSVRISLSVLRFGRARLWLTDMAGLPMLTFTRTPTDALALALKRAYDLTVSVTALLLLAPLLVGIAAAIKLDSAGPVLFRQRRVGLNGRIFSMLKFRSMHVDAEARLAELQARNEMSGPVFKMTDDPRVTRVGRFIRKASLDELPQFWNVLVGDMSVVGPRPPIPAEVRRYQRWQRRRLSVRPGITCTWQVSGRNGIDFDRWMELDLEYIDKWSLWQDVRICLKTIPAVLTARGAR